MLPYGICTFVYLELLQGARDEAEYQELRDYLESQRLYDLRSGLASFERAACTYYEYRRSGTTIRSTIDPVITLPFAGDRSTALSSDP